MSIVVIGTRRQSTQQGLRRSSNSKKRPHDGKHTWNIYKPYKQHSYHNQGNHQRSTGPRLAPSQEQRFSCQHQTAREIERNLNGTDKRL